MKLVQVRIVVALPDEVEDKDVNEVVDTILDEGMNEVDLGMWWNATKVVDPIKVVECADPDIEKGQAAFDEWEDRFADEAKKMLQPQLKLVIYKADPHHEYNDDQNQPIYEETLEQYDPGLLVKKDVVLQGSAYGYNIFVEEASQ